jgi:RNA polymerase sigma-70 factor (ECF subfamily)
VVGLPYVERADFGLAQPNGWAPRRRSHGKMLGTMAARDRAERRLAKRLARRDPEALRELHALHGAAIFGFLVRGLGDRAAAEDVQQQVFLEAWERGDRYDPERAGLRVWLLAIARSRAIDQLRRRVPEPRDPSSAVALAERGDETRLDELVEHWHLVAQLERLPAEEADLLRRRFYLDQSQSQIAAATGIPLGTVKTRMSSGLRRLRTALEGEA